MKKIFTLLIAMLLTRMTFAQVSTWNGSWEPWTHGTGTEADPFLIENAQQLAYLAYRVNNGLDAEGGYISNPNLHYKLMIDIDLNGSENMQWIPIGYNNSSNSQSDAQYFGGHFDGNYHTISRLYINSVPNSLGLFGYITGASILNTNICGDIFIRNDTPNTSYNTISTSYSVGGLIGFASVHSTIKNCSSNCNISIDYTNYDNYDNSIMAGGISGELGDASLIENCYSKGNISLSFSCNHNLGLSFYIYSRLGGLVGDAFRTTIRNCYNTGNILSSISLTNCNHVSLTSYTGGIVGLDSNIVGGSYSSFLSNSYNTGEVNVSFQDFGGENNNNNSYIGGIRGLKDDSAPLNVSDCYYLVTCGGNSTFGGTPMSEIVMKSEEFVDILNDGACSWALDNTNMNNGYPILTMITSSAETYQATNVAATSATLHGSVYTENTSIISKGFEYRKIGNSDYASINITNNSEYFSYSLTGLAINTTYEYRTFLNVADCDVTSYGDTKTFTLSLLNNDTICIYDAETLRWVSEQCNCGTTFEGYCIKLMNDITLPENVPNNMTSIGKYPNYPFKGTFDGNGKLIYNLYIDQPNTPYQGFFGYTLNANLYNVGLVNITASGRNYTGGMVAYAANTNMRDCYVNGGTLFALSYCGGLVGYQEQGTNSIISGCYNTCEVTGNNYVGGLIGFSNYSTVRNSYVAGRVAAQGEPVGAIIGGANEVLMYYCYFSIELTGQTNAIGWNNIGKDGGEGMTNAQMRDPQFVNTLNQNLATPVWMADYATHINNGFPIIKWQRPGSGVEEHDAAKSYISLYPNPAKAFVSIQSDDPSVSLKHIEVYDVTGRKVMSEELDGQNQDLSVAKLLSGVYYVRVQASNGCHTYLKLVVQ